MNGNHHRQLLYALFLPTLLTIIYMQIKGYIYADLKFSIFFILLWAAGTWVWTPDIDLVLPFIKHRGITHNFTLWFLIGVVGYFSIGWYVVSFPITQEIHIISDHFSTGIKRTF